MNATERLLDEITQAIEDFSTTHQRPPKTIVFRKPKANELLHFDPSYWGEPVPFIGRDGVKGLVGRTICGVTIEIEELDHGFHLE